MHTKFYLYGTNSGNPKPQENVIVNFYFVLLIAQDNDLSKRKVRCGWGDGLGARSKPQESEV